MKTNFTFRFFALLIAIIAFSSLTTNSQVEFRDVYGNPLPTPGWPPPDSLYQPNAVTVWFNSSIINKDYLCNYWDIIESPHRTKSLDEEPGLTVGCFDIDSPVILDTNVINLLKAFSAVRMCQYTNFNPCKDTLSYTRYGTTIPTPEFWNSFYIELEYGWAADLIQALLLYFGGMQIDFAELIQRYGLDSQEPNDQYWNRELNYMNGFYYENVLNAWDIEHGSRDIKVAVVDDGIDYMLQDLGGGIGPGYRVVGGIKYNLNTPYPNTSNGGHGTPCAGLIGAMVNNTTGVAGIAGGWNQNEGVSLYSLQAETGFEEEYINLWTQAAAATSGGKGFGVHVISNSNGIPYYSEQLRRVLDYAYRLGVCCVASKGNDDDNKYHIPGDLEYYKIIDVGNYGVKHESGDDRNRWIPTRARGYENGGLSNFGYGLDIMAQGDNRNPTILKNQTLADRADGLVDNVRWFSNTSAAAPQVAGVASLILSEYHTSQHTNIDGLAPEDVQGLLCISAMDMNFYYNSFEKDSNGYDAETGYGLLKADVALQYMMEPYELKYFTESGGTSAEQTPIDDFVVLQPSYGNAILHPSQKDVYEYRAVRHTVRKTVDISLQSWTNARSWGRGGDFTIGWSGAQPMNSDNIQTGYCRVVGNPDAQDNNPDNFNYNNIRDICYSNDQITLETYCYEVWNKINNDEYLGWFPCPPENVIYRYTIWGTREHTGVEEVVIDSKISIRCESLNLLGIPTALIHYSMSNPGPVSLSIFDNLGNLILEKNRDFWSYDKEQTISVNMEQYSNGVYYVILKASNGAAFGKFLLIK